MKNVSSFHKKSLFYFIVFSVTILLLLWLFQIFYLKYSYEQYQVKNLDDLASTIQNASLMDLSKTLETVAYQNEVCVEYFTNSGQTIRYNTLMNGCALGKNNGEILKVQQDFMNSGKDKQPFRLVNKEYEAKAYLYGMALPSGIVFLYNTLEDVSGANAVLKNQLIYLTILAIIFACGIAYFLSKKLTEPIHDITEKARTLGSGLEVVFPNYDIEEVNELVKVLKRAQEDMLKTDELRRDLLANVSHDLKTPLTMIKAYAEMVRDLSFKDDEKRMNHCNIIMDEVDRLNLLVTDILALSKMQANADDIVLEEFDLVKEIKTIVSRYEIIKETEDYHFELDLPEKAIIRADKAKLNQVIYNLINNAINYTGKDKTVTVSVKKEKDSYL